MATVAGDRGSTGATNSFDEFYRCNRDRLVASLAVGLGDLDLATEAVDHAMAKAWGRWDRLDDQADAGAWVYRVARNWALSWRRRLRFRSGRDVPDVAAGLDDQLSPDPALRRALRCLNEHHRSVVVLRLVHEMSVEETAVALGIAPGTVKSRLSRALDRVRHDMDGMEVER